MEERVDVVIDSSAAKRGIDVLVDSVQKLNKSFNVTEAGIDKFFNKFSSGLDQAQRGLMTLKNIAIAFGAIIGTFRQLGQEMSKFQAFISAMSVSVGGVKNARTEYKFLMEMSDRLGVSINSLSHNYSQLAAAAQGTSITTEKLRDIFESFSIAARTMHLSTIDTRLMFYALTQMVSKGSVSMEELRRQLGEKLPGAMKIAAQSVNATSDELEAAIRKGMVDPAKFLPLFADAVRKTFSPGLALAMQAFDAEVNRMTNSLQKMLVQMYDLGVAEAFTGVLREINRILNDPTTADALANAIKDVSDRVRNFLSTIGPDQVKKFMSEFASGMQAIGQAIIAILPAIKTMAENMRTIIVGGSVVAGMYAGGKMGALAGPKGAIGGAVIGGIAGGAGAGLLLNQMDTNQAAGNAVRGQIRGATGPAGGNYQAWLFGNTPDAAEARKRFFKDGPNGSAKLSDVLKAPEGGKTNAMDTFIRTLMEQNAVKGDETNRYDAWRIRAKELGKKYPGRLNEALSIIDSMEKRGDELDPLMSRILNIMDRADQDTPQAINREIERMIAKYPRAGNQQQLKDAGKAFENQFNAKKAREQQAFDDKQEEVLRRMQVERDLIAEQTQLIGKGADEREIILKKLEMERRLEEQIVMFRKEAMLERRKFDEQGFRDRGKQEIEATLNEMKKLQDANKTAEAGFKSALQTYIDSVRDMATQTNNLVTRAFKGMEDALVEFVKTGKLNFRSLADSIIEDLIRIQVRKGIVGPLSQILNAVLPAVFGGGSGGGAALTPGGTPMIGDFGFANVAHTGGIVGGALAGRMINMGVFAGAPRFHTGGIVGDEQPIIAKRREGIFTPEQMRALAPIGRGQGNITIQVNVDAESGDTQVQSPDNASNMKALAESISFKVREEIIRQKRPGGLLSQS